MQQAVLNKTSTSYLFKKAKNFFMKGKFNEAIRIYDGILQDDPSNVQALAAAMETLCDFGQLNHATKYANLILKNASNNSDCLAWVAFLIIRVTDNESSKFIFELLNKARSLNSRNAIVHAVYAFYKADKMRYDEAVEECKIALKINPNQAIALRTIAFCYQKRNQRDLSFDYYKKALKNNPNHLTTLDNLARLYLIKGKFVTCVSYARKILVNYPDSVFSLTTIASVEKISSESDQIAIKIKNVLDDKLSKVNSKTSKEDIAELQFALGDIYDRSKKFDEAFKYYLAGNKTICDISPANNDPLMEKMAYGKEEQLFPDKTFFEKRKNYGVQSNVPLFIVGVPRCGSTLTEQVLTCHSRVESIGESSKIKHLIKNRICKDFIIDDVYPEILKKLSKSKVENIAQEYLIDLKSKYPNSTHILEKTLFNSLYQGAIRLLFPQAKIIHCKRHPLDSCFSSFSKNFIASGLDYSKSLETIAKFYKEYHIISKRYEKIISSEFTYNVYYEAFVGNFEAEARSLLNFCGLEWEDQCLSFYKNKRQVRTASNTQVRQPIYQDAKYRWKNYEPYIQPLIEELKSEIAEYEEELSQHINKYNK